MMLLIKLAELVIIFFIIRSFINLVLSPKGEKTSPKDSTEKPKRFDSSSHDISDADYEDV